MKTLLKAEHKKKNKTTKQTHTKQSRNVRLNASDANNCSRWRLGVNTISSNMR